MGITNSSVAINELTSALLTFQLEKYVDGAWTALPVGELLTLTLTLYEETTETILNTRNAQNVFNTNNVTVSASGFVTWQSQPADNSCVGTALLEEHVALFEWSWADGQGSEEIHYYIANLAQVP